MSAPESSPAPSLRALVTLFFVALAVRCAYAIALYAAFGAAGIQGPDSGGYLDTARRFVEAIAAGKVAGWGWVGPDLSLMPLYTWAMTLNAALAGEWAPLSITLAQGIVGAGTCLFIAGIARLMAPLAALWAGYAAAFTPTFIVLSGLVYTDTLFVFFATASLYASLRWLDAPSLRRALLLGAALGLAAMVRVLIAPWAVPLGIFLAAAALIRRARLAQTAQLLATAAVVAAFLAPVVGRNAALYGAWALTPQSGNHYAFWVVSLVKEFADGTPRETTNKINNARFEARFGPVPANPFVASARYTVFAREELQALGLGAVAKGWAYGAAINLAAPAIVHVPPVSALPRRGFYDTPGANFGEKLQAFLFGSGSTLYAWLLMLGLAGVAAFRLVQIVGIVSLLRHGASWAGLLLLLGWCLYILAINGPVASPKYRLPLEPALAVFTGLGLAALFGGRRRSGQA